MRKVYRSLNNDDYWNKRWKDAKEDKDYFENLNIYPIKYSKKTIGDNKKSLILEAGCGLGRILKHHYNEGYNIVGMEYNAYCLEQIRKKYPKIRVIQADIRNLPFKDEEFDIILAFGLYHNLEEKDIDKALKETRRCLKKGGKLCASVRADNLETRLIDFITYLRTRDKKQNKFHKICFKPKEFSNILKKHGFLIKFVEVTENVPFLFKFKIFRSKKLSKFDESIARSEGFKMNILGRVIQKILRSLFPNSFGNTVVIICTKK